jgi:hypothetical protein
MTVSANGLPCSTCQYRWETLSGVKIEGHCYMFKHEPDNWYCGRYKPDRAAIAKQEYDVHHPNGELSK